MSFRVGATIIIDIQLAILVAIAVCAMYKCDPNKSQ